MSKAVLVMDMPNSCKECNILFWDEYSANCPWKYAKIDVYNYVENKSKPDWCPLKPLPEEDNGIYFIEWTRGYKGGWNDCIKAILNR